MSIEARQPDGDVLWRPRPDAGQTTAIGAFADLIRNKFAVAIKEYDDLWAFSVERVEDFWATFAEFEQVHFATAPQAILEHPAMPGARWFRGATLNYVERALSGPDDEIVIEARSQTRATKVLTRGELREEVARVRGAFKALGIKSGDRVAAYLPSLPETIIAFLAAAGLGAIFVSCAPELGTQSVIDRLGQVTPTVLLTVDGYRYGEKAVDRVSEIARIRAALPSLRTVIVVPYLDGDRAAEIADAVPWDSLYHSKPAPEHGDVPFAHPLYILFSSGSTGLPKPIVHSHGGMLLEHLKWLRLHCDLSSGDRMFSPASTSWMAWNTAVSVLLCGATLIIFDGELAYPNLAAFWTMLSEAGVTHFGSSPPFLQMCRKEGLMPRELADLSALRVLTTGGSPLSAELHRWIYEAIADDVMVASISGGTDVCTAFVGGCLIRPVYAGEISCRALGVRVEAFDPDGNSLVNAEGELVITAPMPSMPVQFWGDVNDERYRAAYFDRYEGVWRHGDWITITDRGTAIVSGRSDATLNRAGVRIGTQELYSALDSVPAVQDSLVVHVEDATNGRGNLILFVALTSPSQLSRELELQLRQTLCERLSPRHVPDEIHAVPSIPRTPTGKRLEVPIKRLLTGQALPEEVALSVQDPAVLEPFVNMVRPERRNVAVRS